MKKKSFVKNSFFTIGGSAVAQAFTIFLYPIVARLYGVDGIGLFGVFLSIVSVVGMTSTLRMERRVLSSKCEADAQVYLSLSLGFSLVVSVVGALIVSILLMYNLLPLEFYVVFYVLSFSVLFGINQSCSALFSRYNLYQKFSVVIITRAVVVGGLQIVFYYIFESYAGMMLGAVVGFLISSMVCLYLLKANNVFIFFVTDSFISNVDYIKIKEGFYGGVQSLSSALSGNSPVILVAALWGVEQAGYYVLAEKVVRAPINLISNNLRNVIITGIKTSDNCDAFIRNVVFFMMFTSVLAFCCFYYLSDWFFLIAFGPGWDMSSDVAKVMFIFVIFNFSFLVYSSYNTTYSSFKKLAIFEIVFLILKVVSLFVIYSLGFGLIEAAAAVAFVSSMNYLAHFIMYYKNKGVVYV